MNLDALEVISAIICSIGAAAILTLIMDAIASYVMRSDRKQESQLRRSLGVMEAGQ